MALLDVGLAGQVDRLHRAASRRGASLVAVTNRGCDWAHGRGCCLCTCVDVLAARQFGVSPKHQALVYIAAMVSEGVPLSNSPSSPGAPIGTAVFNPMFPSLAKLTFPQFVEALLRCASLSVVKVRGVPAARSDRRQCLLTWRFR